MVAAVKMNKHLVDPRKTGRTAGHWIGEWDPVLSHNSWYQRASNASVCTLGVVGTSRVLYAYGFILSNFSAVAADVRIREGATVKLRQQMIANDTMHIGFGNPRAPICKFNALAPVFITSYPAQATVHVTMSWWDAEIT